MNDTPEHRAYRDAKYRCTNKRCKSYRDYGGRGIQFLFSSFIQFYTEVGKRPGAGYSLDRILVDGNYQPGNVQWSTLSEQRYNQRRMKKCGKESK